MISTTPFREMWMKDGLQTFHPLLNVTTRKFNRGAGSMRRDGERGEAGWRRWRRAIRGGAPAATGSA